MATQLSDKPRVVRYRFNSRIFVSGGWTAADLLSIAGAPATPISPYSSSSSLSDGGSAGAASSDQSGRAPSTPPTSPPTSTKPSPEHSQPVGRDFPPATAPAMLHSVMHSPSPSPALAAAPCPFPVELGASGFSRAAQAPYAQTVLSLELKVNELTVDDDSLEVYLAGLRSCLVCSAKVEPSSSNPDGEVIIKLAETASAKESLLQEYQVYSKMHSKADWSDRCIGLYSSHDGTFNLLVLRNLGTSPKSLKPYLRDLREEVMALHLANIQHGDIAERNVCIGHDGRARLIDFGASNTNHNACTTECGDRIAVGL